MDYNLSKIGFGYACISSLIKKCSTAGTVPLGSFKKIKDKEGQAYRLEKVARKNLTNTTRLLWHNIAEGFQLYRFSSQLIPLGNHPAGEVFNYREVLSSELKKIGRIVEKHNLRVSTHPGQYTVINAQDEGVFQNAILDLNYHDRVLTAMGLDNNGVMVVHVGGVYGDKKTSLQRFIDNFYRLPQSVQNRLVIENDDTSYSIKDVLYLCNQLKRPMVLDVHHHECNNQGEKLEEYLPEIFHTWDNLKRPPKVHFSSPKSKKQPLSHADYLEPRVFTDFLQLAGERIFDAMIEAKQYDAAILKLWDDLGYKP